MADLVIQQGGLSIQEYTYVPAGTANNMPNDGRTLLLVKTGAGASGTMTVNSVPCSHARSLDIALAMAATKFYVVGPLPPALFNQTDDQVDVDFTSATDIELAAIQL